jgi:hypothetical protein
MKTWVPLPPPLLQQLLTHCHHQARDTRLHRRRLKRFPLPRDKLPPSCIATLNVHANKETNRHKTAVLFIHPLLRLLPRLQFGPEQFVLL